MRINKFFTDRGYCSRREADRMVEEGRVSINGRVAVHGDQIELTDEIRVDGELLDSNLDKKPIIIAFNKPVGVECTSDPTVENNIIEAVGFPERIFHIGRLDKMSEGLILLTNVGDIVNKILRRRYGHEKEYIVVFDLPISDEQILTLRRGVDIGDEEGPTGRCQVTRLGGSRVSMILTEGRNRQIRRMAEAIGLKVVRLKRIRVMNITLGEMPKGRWRYLTPSEEAELTARLEGLDPPKPT